MPALIKKHPLQCVCVVHHIIHHIIRDVHCATRVINQIIRQMIIMQDMRNKMMYEINRNCIVMIAIGNDGISRANIVGFN